VEVDLGGVDLFMAEPGSAYGGVDVGMQEPHRGGMQQHVEPDLLVRERWAGAGPVAVCVASRRSTASRLGLANEPLVENSGSLARPPRSSSQTLSAVVVVRVSG
jgi:hypothetical protein